MSDTGDAMVRLFGGILLGVGILIATASGLCSVAVLFGSGRSFADVAGTVLLFGGGPFLIGVVLILIGKSMLGVGSTGRHDNGA